MTDIEVENTHNFITNGIVAHNTYINGNLGIGTTNPTYNLDLSGSLGVSSTAYFASYVGIGITAPTRLLDVYGDMRLDGQLYDENNSVGTPGQILSTTATGTDWIAAGGGDFSDGGEAGGADRTLGNTDDYDLGFLTNNLNRLQI